MPGDATDDAENPGLDKPEDGTVCGGDAEGSDVNRGVVEELNDGAVSWWVSVGDELDDGVVCGGDPMETDVVDPEAEEGNDGSV
jgi:hypothetical protein